MTPVRRWLMVAALLVAVVSLPLAPRLLPAKESDLGAAQLLDRLRGSPDQGWSGYLETTGTLQLPAAGDLDDLGSLLGETTRLRVWWRDAGSWRVDRLLTAGESGLRHAGGVTVSYSYEAQRAEVSRDPDVRLPRSSDLLPAELARRFVLDAEPDAVEALPARRVAGVSAAGLRVDGSADPRTTIGRIDVWLDPATGVPLLVQVYAKGSEAPALTSEVRDYDPGTPPVSVIDFDPTPQTEVERLDVLDIAEVASRYAPFRPPAEAAGLARQRSSSGAVGVYGRGLTQLIAIPLRDDEADPLREQVAVTPGAVADAETIGAVAGPLGVLIGGRAGDGGWLVAGTLGLGALRAAEADLRTGADFVWQEGQ